MSGGNTTQELGQGALMGGLLASNIMTGGADAELDPAALAAIEGGQAAGSSFIPAAGMGADLFSSAVPSGIADLGGSALDEGLSSDMAMEVDPNAVGSAEGTGVALPDSQYTGQYTPPTVNPTQAMSQDVGGGSYNGFQPYGENAPPLGSNAALPPQQQTGNSFWNQLTNTNNPGGGMNFLQKAGLGGAGIATLLALQKSGAMKPNYLPTYNPKTASQVGAPAGVMAANYQPQRASQWGYATGGITDPVASSKPTNVMPADLQSQTTAVPAALQSLMSQYGVTQGEATQGINSLMGNQASPTSTLAAGGMTNLKEGSFVVPADVVSHFGNGSTDAGLAALHKHLGAHPIMGEGDGMSDSIPTTIDGKQPARVANGEALIHPERVKELGNGSSDVGAKKLYAMMDKVRKARTGNSKQGKQIKADKYLPT